MAIIHDWHKPEHEQERGNVYVNVEPLLRVDPDGVLSLRFIDKQGRVLAIVMSAAETDRLAEFLWTDRK